VSVADPKLALRLCAVLCNRLDGAVDGAANKSMTINAAHIDFASAVGKTSPLGSLKTSGLVYLADSVSTTGSQVYQGELMLVDDVTLTGSSIELPAVDVWEGSDVPEVDLTLAAPATFGGAIGGVNPLHSLTAGDATMGGGSVRTTGTQNYTGTVQLSSDVSVYGDATFAGAIGGSGGLITSGDVKLNGANTYTGATHVAGGQLTLNGSVTSDVLVTDAILTGHGTITGNLEIGPEGLLAPTPHATARLTVSGNLTFDAYGGFEMTGSDANTLGRVSANVVSLNDASLFDLTEFSVLEGERLEFIEATDLDGEFYHVPNDALMFVAGSDVFATYETSASPHKFVITGDGEADYGDSPFASLKIDHGAAHRAVGPMLGATRTAENDAVGIPGELLPKSQTGIAANDNDGVTLIEDLVASDADADSDGLFLTASAAAKLDAWMDFNQDGDWLDSGEQIFTSADVSAGDNVLSFTIPAGTLPGHTYARFRLSTAGGLAPTGLTVDGEVEDYLVTFHSAGTAAPVSITLGDQPAEITLENDHIVTRFGSQIVSSIPLSSAETLTIYGDGTNNTVTVDSAAIPAGGLIYNGNGSGDLDVLNVRNAAGDVVAVTHTFDNAHDGQIEIDGKSITYTGLEPIEDAAAATDRAFRFGPADDQVTLGEGATAGDNTSRISSIASSELVDFRNPSGSLVIDLADGNNTLVLGTRDAGLTAPITVQSGIGSDTLRSATGDLDLSGTTLSKQFGTWNVDSRVVGTSPATSGDYQLVLLAGAQTTGAQTFANLAGVTLGDEPTDTFDFAGGLSNTASPTTVQGTVRATGQTITLADVVLADATTFTAATIALGSVTGSSDLTLDGDVRLNGFGIDTTGNLAIDGGLTLDADATIAHSGTTVLSDPIGGAFSLMKAGDGTLQITDRTFAGTLFAGSGTVELPNGLAGLVFVDGGTIRATGTLDAGVQGSSGGGSLVLGSGPAAVASAGDVFFDPAMTLHMDLNGNDAGTGYDQLRVTAADGSVDLAGATLDLSLGYSPAVGTQFTLVDLVESTSTLTGGFANFDEGHIVTVDGTPLSISFAGGDGNDVVLTVAPTGELDFGDAPATYNTGVDQEGARHLATGPMLGATRDVEATGTPSASADGDDQIGTDDEDGVTLAALTASESANLTVNVQNAAGGARLDAWIDWNGDFAFDAGESIAGGISVVEGDNTLSVNVPANAALGETFARFRLSTSGGLAPTGMAADGEVEDYAVTISDFDEPPTVNTISDLTVNEDQDADGNGQIDTQIIPFFGVGPGGSHMDIQATRVTASADNATLIPDLAVDYVEGALGGDLSFTPPAAAPGQATITVTVRDTGLDGQFDTQDDGATTTSFTVNITPVNDLPTLNSIYDIFLDTGATQHVVDVTGITAGGGETQSVELSASTVSDQLVSAVQTSHAAGATTGQLTLNFAENARGVETVTVRVRDPGLDGTFDTGDDATHQTQFQVSLSNPPTLDPIPYVRISPTVGEQTINLTGITDGEGTSGLDKQRLQLTVTSADTSVVDTPVIDYDAENFAATGQLRFTPLAVGTSEITVTVTDTGLDGQSGTADDRTLVRTFTIDVSNTAWQNPFNAHDVNFDGVETPLDVLQLINFVNGQGSVTLAPRTSSDTSFYDVDGENNATPTDVLQVINSLNGSPTLIPEGEASGSTGDARFVPSPFTFDLNSPNQIAMPSAEGEASVSAGRARFAPSPLTLDQLRTVLDEIHTAAARLESESPLAAPTYNAVKHFG